MSTLDEMDSIPTILGMHIGHNSSLALFAQGAPAWAVQEERLTRTKNQGGVPSLALEWGRRRTDLDPVETALGWANLSRRQWTREAMMERYGGSGRRVNELKRWLRKVPLVGQAIDKRRAGDLRADLASSWGTPPGDLVMVDHHLSHGSAAYFGRGAHDGKTLVLTCDGAGDGVCATVSLAKGNAIERIAEVGDRHSVGRLYALVTYLMGMVPLEHEYKLMGMAPYGEGDSVTESVAGAFEELFSFDGSEGMQWKTTVRGGMRAALPRVEQLLRRVRFDRVAAGLQLFLERFLSTWVANCVRATGVSDVVLGGGVFMNVKANQEILALPEVESLYIFPSCGDETNCFGAAYAHLELNRDKRTKPIGDLYLGDDITGEEVDDALARGVLEGVKVRVRDFENERIDEEVGRLLAAEGIVARARGRMEFGARALGNRSILADPAKPGVVRTINTMIKQRDFWMPFAPAVLSCDFDRYFVRRKDMAMPFMIMGCDTVASNRDEIRGAIHPQDFSARPMEVDPEVNADFATALRSFRDHTGRAAVLNTSFNLHGEPIVSTAADALRVFRLSGLPALAVGPFLIQKE